MAGFDSDGHIVRLTFSQDDARLEQEGLLIGRDAKTCELHMNDSSVSRRHARLFSNQGALWIEDLGSTNGILINGVKMFKGGAVALPGQGNITLGAVDLSIGTY